MPENGGWTENSFNAENWLPTLKGKVMLWKFKNKKSESTVFQQMQVAFIWGITLYIWTCPSTIFSPFKKVTRPQRGRLTLYCLVEHSRTILLSVKPAWLVKQLNICMRKSISRASCSSVKQLNNFYAEVDESDFVFSGSLPSTGNMYIRLKPASLIKLLESSMIFSMHVLNALSLRDGRLI